MRFTAALLLAAALVSAAAAQAVIINRSAGLFADSPYNALYNRSSVITFKGKVTGIEAAPPMPNMGNVVSLIVKSPNGGTSHVDVGPEWYVVNQVTQVKLKDEIQVTGSKVMVDGRSVILAEMIVKGKNVLTLRAPSGRPYWDATAVVTVPPVIVEERIIAGQVVRIESFIDGTAGQMQRMLVRTENGDMWVSLAPQWFMDRQPWGVSLGDQIRVQTVAPGFTAAGDRPTQMPTLNTVAATTLWNGSRWMILRLENGRPVWYAADGR